MNDRIYGGIEAGGTKFICAVGTSPDNIASHIQIPTTTPTETLDSVISFFKGQSNLAAIGIGSFGPLDLNKDSPSYGHITNTPKPGWSNTDIVGAITGSLNIPVEINSDVNCAVLGEQLYGAGQGLSNVAYMTVGTGIGIGDIVDGHFPSGLTHTEMGHMMIPNDDPEIKSACPFHANCLEGLASGFALQKRFSKPVKDITDNNAWAIEARYLAYGVANTIVSLMPNKIIVGGGVMNHENLLASVRAEVIKILNGYPELPEITQEIDSYIVAPSLGTLSGVTGALSLAYQHIS
ncbi:MAG: ROK family protein [Candidatus Saccharimonadales bacterium]